MKKTLLGIVAIGVAMAFSLNAAEEGKKKEMSPEAKALYKEIVKKYDTDGDGKLSKEEKEKISAEDKEKMAKAGIGGGKKKQ